jgi:hypothetical protein
MFKPTKYIQRNPETRNYTPLARNIPVKTAAIFSALTNKITGTTNGLNNILLLS